MPVAMSAPDKLYYLRLPKAQGGRAESVRLTYVLAGRPYTDVFVERASFREAVNGRNPFRQYPFVETASGKILYQSLAIMHHAGVGTRAWPSEPERLTDALSIGLGAYDLYEAFADFMPDDLAARKKFEERRAPQYFGALDAIYRTRAFAAGDTPSFADAMAYEAVGWCVRRNDVCKGLYEGLSGLVAFRARFAEIPEVKAFIDCQARARQIDDAV